MSVVSMCLISAGPKHTAEFLLGLGGHTAFTFKPTEHNKHVHPFGFQSEQHTTIHTHQVQVDDTSIVNTIHGTP